MFERLRELEDEERRLAAMRRPKGFPFRMCLCLLAVLLIWISSLSVTQVFVASVVNRPSYKSVRHRWSVLSATVSLERSNNIKCLSASYTAIRAAASDSYATQLETLQATDLSRTNTNKAIDTLGQSCKATLTDAISTFINHQQSGGEIIFNTNACSKEEIQSTKSILFSDAFSALSQSSALYSQAVDNYTVAFENFTTSAEDRYNYDSTYVQNKTGKLTGLGVELTAIPLQLNTDVDFSLNNFLTAPDLAYLQGCLSLSSNCPDFRNVVLNGINSVNSVVEAFASAYTLAMKTAHSYEELVLYRLSQVESIFSVLRSVPDLDFANLFGDLQLPSLNLPSLQLPTMPNVTLGSIDGLSLGLGPLSADMLVDLTAARERMKQEIVAAMLAVK